jgi:hypothetical protein
MNIAADAISKFSLTNMAMPFVVRIVYIPFRLPSLVTIEVAVSPGGSTENSNQSGQQMLWLIAGPSGYCDGPQDLCGKLRMHGHTSEPTESEKCEDFDVNSPTSTLAGHTATCREHRST